jgi:hypothetical protein
VVGGSVFSSVDSVSLAPSFGFLLLRAICGTENDVLVAAGRPTQTKSSSVSESSGKGGGG